jgi:predicted DNA-binding protein
MSLEEKVSLTITIPKNYRDRLRTMAAQQNLHDPDQLTSASTIAREIICEYIDEIDCLEDDFAAGDNAAKSLQEPGQDESTESATDK